MGALELVCEGGGCASSCFHLTVNIAPWFEILYPQGVPLHNCPPKVVQSFWTFVPLPNTWFVEESGRGWRKQACMFYVSLSVAGSYFSHVLSPPRHRSSLLIYSWQSHGGCSIIADKWFFKTLSPLVFFLFPSYPYLSLLLVAETVGFLCTLTLFISLQGKTELSFLTHCQSLSSSKVFHLIYTFFFFPMDLAFSFRCSKFPSLLQYSKAPSISALLSALKPLRTCLCFPLLPCFALCPLCSATAWT